LDSAAGETRAGWQQFVRDSEAGAHGEKETSADVAAASPVVAHDDVGSRGRADVESSRPQEVAGAPAQEQLAAGAAPDGEERADRAAVLGEPPSTVSTQRAEALKDAASESERNETEAKAALERQANAARASGEVIESRVLRSFRIGADGVWYEKGYDGQATTSLPRESDALRELMKKYPESDWNKLLDRPHKQVFQMGDDWYALEAEPETR
jgi:hypothetical protein